MRLHRDIERADRLVGNDDLWIDCQRPRDADALPLAAGELVGVATAELIVQSDRDQELAHAIGAFRFGHDLVKGECFFQRLPDGHARIE